MPRRASDEPKINELKKQLRVLRLKECPPISKMRKAHVKEEIERLRAPKAEAMDAEDMEVTAPKPVPKPAKNPSKKPAARVDEPTKPAPKAKAPRRQSIAEAIVPAVLKRKAEPRKPAASFEKAPARKQAAKKDADEMSIGIDELAALSRKKKRASRFPKGSQEAKDHMAAVRAARKK